MKKNLFFSLFLLTFPFLGCDRFPDYPVSINVQALTMDDKPLPDYTVFCLQSLSRRKTKAVTDANGKATLNLITSWDESSNDVFTVSADTANGLIAAERGEFTRLEKNEVGNVTLRFDKIRNQKIRFIGASDSLRNFIFSLNHGGPFNGKTSSSSFGEWFQISETWRGSNLIRINGLPKDTTISLMTGENMSLHLNVSVQLMNQPDSKIDNVKYVFYNYQQARPDTTIIVKY
jgi:hypothetical protein